MRFKKILLFSAGALLVVAVLAVFLTPLLVANGLRLWMATTAKQNGLNISFEKLDAPFLRPVVVEKLKITSQTDAPLQVMVEVPRVDMELHLAAIVDTSHGRFLRSLTAESIGVDIRRNTQEPTESPRIAPRIMEDLLPDNFKLSQLGLHIENGDTIVDLQNGVLTGAQIEAGVFSASEITIVSPWFRKSFSQLRGVTSWQNRQLTIGALALTRGLDLDSLIIDLSHIDESRVGLELALDAFGGKLRARISNEDREDKRTWDVAGTAAEISLAQMSDALDLTDRASGSLHACKFTFRGESTNLREATASIWAEVTEMTWRDRTADTIMIGASLYNKQVQVEQLFVKQRNNQFTLSGESALPQKWSDWLNPDFHGDISASINDLGDFARLFGASASDFAGTIGISGRITARERKLGGQLSASGTSLTLFRAPFESLRMELNVKESVLEVTDFELRRNNDSFRGHASLDLAHDRSYSFTFTSSIAATEDYAGLIPETWQIPELGGSLDLTWTGHGTEETHSGSFYAWGHSLHLLKFPIMPFDAELECDYSPDNIFFRQFNLSNQHAGFSAFVTVAKDYLQLQALRLDLNGKCKLQGNVCLPFSLSKMKAPNTWLEALNDNPIFDLNVTLEPIDLAELSAAVTKQPSLSGIASGSLQLYGGPTSLEGRSITHLRDFVFGNESPLSMDLEMRSAIGVLNAKGLTTVRGSSPVYIDGSIPFGLEKRESGYAFKTGGPVGGTINFPAVLLSKLPSYVSRWMFVDGILTGRLNISGSSSFPQVRGATHLINGRFLGGMSLSAGVSFEGQTAVIDFIQAGRKGGRNGHTRGSMATTYTAHGEIDFHDLTDIKMKILPNLPVTSLTRIEPDDCVNEIELAPTGAAGLLRRERIDEIDFRGGLFASNWTISFSDKPSPDGPEALLQDGSTRTFSICSDLQPSARTLTLGVGQFLFP